MEITRWGKQKYSAKMGTVACGLAKKMMDRDTGASLIRYASLPGASVDSVAP